MSWNYRFTSKILTTISKYPTTATPTRRCNQMPSCRIVWTRFFRVAAAQTVFRNKRWRVNWMRILARHPSPFRSRLHRILRAFTRRLAAPTSMIGVRIMRMRSNLWAIRRIGHLRRWWRKYSFLAQTTTCLLIRIGSRVLAVSNLISSMPNPIQSWDLRSETPSNST